MSANQPVWERFSKKLLPLARTVGRTSTYDRDIRPRYTHMRDDMRSEVGAVAMAGAGAGNSRAGLLPTTLSWQGVPRHTLMLMDEAMEHVDDEDRSAALSRGRYSDQVHSVADAAIADTDAEAADAAPLNNAGAPQSKKKLKLSEKDALAIFQAKRCNKGRRSTLSVALGRRYGMNAKSVRDIWIGRTWAKATRPFWTAEERKAYAARRTQSDNPEHPTPYPTPIAHSMHLPCTYSLQWPCVVSHVSRALLPTPPGLILSNHAAAPYGAKARESHFP